MNRDRPATADGMEIEALRQRLAEAEDVLRAIGLGDVDVLLGGDCIYARRETEEPYRILVETMNEGAAVLAADGTITYCNARLAAMLGYPLEWLIGSRFTDHVQPDCIALLEVHCDPSATHLHGSTITLRTGTGERLPVLISSSPYRFQDTRAVGVVVTDISAQVRAEQERLLLERQLFQTRKTESLGALAGGIAHDFNNLLMAIIGNTELAMLQLGDDAPARNFLEQTKQAAGRAVALTRQMLAYAGKEQFTPRRFDINILLTDMTDMLNAPLAQDVQLRIEPSPHALVIEADPAQIQQAVMNLAVNAAEAVGDRTGVITITTGVTDYTPAGVPDNGEPFAGGSYTFIRVTDTGCGMDGETRARVFEPFFSTKFTGRGMGIPAALGIARGYRGGIMMDSEQGQGSSFTLLLPVPDTIPADMEQTAHRSSGISAADI